MNSLYTEIADNGVNGSARGWLLYDGDCSVCTRLARRLAPALRRHGYNALPLQADGVCERLNISEAELLSEMRLLSRSSAVLGGADAILELARYFWWARPLRLLKYLPGGVHCLKLLYRWIAEHRACIGGACSTRRFSPIPTILCLLIPLLTALTAYNLPSWAFMWTMAASLWLCLKLLTLLDLGARLPIVRLLAYFFAWPGMDAREFFAPRKDLPEPGADFFAAGVAAALVGICLFFRAAPAVIHISPLFSGWIAMIGIVLTLHFGIFKLLAGIWRRAGVAVTPLMNAPLRAKSLGEFWGRRWNTGFSIPARRLLVERVAPVIGAPAATLLVFLISGLLHELVISLPARGGYGLPTLYFLIQGAAVLFERSKFGTALCGRALTFVVTIGPLFWLFHPPFVARVIIPFLNALKGAVL